ncbi:MAG: SGNH/GDSL hydrolase family protein [Acidobacteria bacterium]|nr:SGNH/GDSL hydrolase family protein [Acidobacteriota bacterium]
MRSKRRRILISIGTISSSFLAGGVAAAANLLFLGEFRHSLRWQLELAAASCFLAALISAVLLIRMLNPAFMERTFRLSSSAWLIMAIAVLLLVVAFLPIPSARSRTGGTIFSSGIVVVIFSAMLAAPEITAGRVAVVIRSNGARRAAFVAWCLASTLVLLEAGTRVLPGWIRPNGVFSSDQRRLRLVPFHPIRGSIGKANSEGYNDVEWTPASNVLRIAAIGDSFVYGVVGYDDNLMTLLEGELSKETGVEVMNFGVPGAGPTDYLEILRLDVLKYRPDVVLLNIYVGNDLRDGLARDRFFVAGFPAGAKVVTNPLQAVVDPARWNLYHLVRIFSLSYTSARNASFGHFVEEKGTYSPEFYGQYASRQLKAFLRKEGPSKNEIRVQRYLDAIVNVSRREDALAVLAIFPTEYQVDARFLETALSYSRHELSDLDLERPQRRLLEWAREHRVPAIDLLPSFRSAAKNERLYAKNDGHWNRKGNGLAAQVLARELTPLLQRRPVQHP